MIIIAFEPNISPWQGGYGDRIVGLISCKMLAKMLNRDFKIKWDKENITAIVNYDKYKYIKNENEEEIVSYNLVNRQTFFKDMLMQSTDIFPSKICKFNLNQEISQYIYLNPHYNKNSQFDYKQDIITTYRSLYTDILLPTPLAQTRIDSLISHIQKPIVGIQIRCGDCYMQHYNIHKVIDNPEQTLTVLLEAIKKHIETTMSEYAVFITSDYANILTISSKIFKSVIYNNEKIQHIDIDNGYSYDGDFSKIYVDNYILSQHCQRLYISTASNYGRVAALSINTEDVFDIYTNKLNKITLVSKHDRVFE